MIGGGLVLYGANKVQKNVLQYGKGKEEIQRGWDHKDERGQKKRGTGEGEVEGRNPKGDEAQ